MLDTLAFPMPQCGTFCHSQCQPPPASQHPLGRAMPDPLAFPMPVCQPFWHSLCQPLQHISASPRVVQCDSRQVEWRGDIGQGGLFENHGSLIIGVGQLSFKGKQNLCRQPGKPPNNNPQTTLTTFAALPGSSTLGIMYARRSSIGYAKGSGIGSIGMPRGLAQVL